MSGNKIAEEPIDWYGKKISSWKLIIVGLAVALVATTILVTSIGTASISPVTTLEIIGNKIPILNSFINQSWSDVEEVIILQVRLPRVILGVLVGASLAAAGVTMQGLFRNPMASPYTIGLSSGATLGVCSAIVLGIQGFGLSLPLMAFLGAMGAAFLVYKIASVGGRVPIETLLLTGIAVALFLSAVNSLLMYLGGAHLHSIFFWSIGGLWWGGTWNSIMIVFPLMLFGMGVIYISANGLNAILQGEETAQYLGIEVETLKKILLISASLVTAAAVCLVGTIGFVGLMIPHIARNIVGPNHRILIPTSILAGGIFLVWTDALARTVISPAELPVGIITALCGGPFFVYLLRRRKKSFWG